MLIKDEKALLQWLARVLEPLTIADPETLAEYVIALLKNDKEEDDLKAHCIEQLLDFLKDETHKFVENLFYMLSDESYLNDGEGAGDDEDDADNRVDFGGKGRRGDDNDEDGLFWKKESRTRRMNDSLDDRDEDTSARKRYKEDDRYNDMDSDSARDRDRDREKNRNSFSQPSKEPKARIEPGLKSNRFSSSKRDGDGSRSPVGGRGYNNYNGQNIYNNGRRGHDERGYGGRGYGRHAQSDTKDVRYPRDIIPGPGPQSMFGPTTGMASNAPFWDDPGHVSGVFAPQGYSDDFMPTMDMMHGSYGFPGAVDMYHLANGMMPPFGRGHVPALLDAAGMPIPFHSGPRPPGPAYVPTGPGGDEDVATRHLGTDGIDAQLSSENKTNAGHRHVQVHGNAPHPPGPVPPPSTPPAHTQSISVDNPQNMLIKPTPPDRPPPVPQSVPVTSSTSNASNISDSASAHPTAPPGQPPSSNLWVPPVYPTQTSYYPLSNVYDPAAPSMYPYGAIYAGVANSYSNSLTSQQDLQPSYLSYNRQGDQATSGRRPSVHGQPIGKNGLPENERCTLLCTGIPTYVKEEEISAHFKSFGRVVQLQITPSESANAGSRTSLDADKQKTYNECLVQFDSSENARKCYSSPQAVLNNRFIRIQQSNFNIIPPADVPPPTAAELQELEDIQRKRALGSTNNRAPLSAPRALAGRAPSRAPIIERNTKFAKNKKYIAGKTPINTMQATNTAPNVANDNSGSDSVNQIANTVEGATGIDVERDKIGQDEQNVDPTSNQDSSNEQVDADTAVVATSTDTKLSSRTAASPSVSTTPTKADMALQQQYEDLRKLRSQVDSIWKTKQAVIQNQIDKYRELIAKLENSTSADAAQMVETVEGKIVNLQSQLQSLNEQRETGALQQTQALSNSNASAFNSMEVRGGRGRGRGFTRGGRSLVGPAFGRSTPGRGLGGRDRWNSTDGRGFRPPITKNMTLDNRPKSLLLSAVEWTRLPESFTSNISKHFARFGELKKLGSLPNGDIVVEYAGRREAEIAKRNGAVYENAPMKLEWYQDGGLDESSRGGGGGLSARQDSNDAMEFDT